METANQDIRGAIRSAGIKHWQVALQLGISDQTLIRWLRVPLSEEKRTTILAAINALAGEKEVIL